MRKRNAAALASALMLGVTGSAAAQDNHEVPALGPGGVSPSGGEVQGAVGTSDELPFTGFHAGLVLLGGAGVALTGLALRRSGRQQKS